MLLEDKLRQNPILSKLSHEITSVALRARNLTSQLLSISRRQVLPAELLDINVVVKGAEGCAANPSREHRTPLRVECRDGSRSSESGTDRANHNESSRKLRDAMLREESS